MASFRIHFDGPITVEHKVSIRVLARTYEHMQRAIDRAYLIEVHGQVWKHARLTDEQYAETEFIAEYPVEGGIILDAVREGAGAIVDRIANSIRPIFETAIQHGLDEHQAIAQQHAERLQYVNAMRRNTPPFQHIAENPPANWAAAYSNRSVVKEIDQLVAQITPEPLQNSSVDITLRGNSAHLPFEFNANIAKRFHKLASRRDLGNALIVPAVIRSLDRGNRYAKPSAKVLNLVTNREVALHLSSIYDFDALHEHHNGEPVELFVCPIIEALGFDVHGGDLMFIAVV